MTENEESKKEEPSEQLQAAVKRTTSLKKSTETQQIESKLNQNVSED